MDELKEIKKPSLQQAFFLKDTLKEEYEKGRITINPEDLHYFFVNTMTLRQKSYFHYLIQKGQWETLNKILKEIYE